MLFLTRELHETIGSAEITGIRSTIASVQRLFPEAHAARIDVAGGVAAFAGADSPLSKAFGIGTFGSVSADDVACVSEFYESRNAVARIFVTPLADPALGATLAQAGYEPAEYDSVMVAVDPERHALRDDRIAVAADVGSWARASVDGFMDRDRNLHDDSLARIVGSAQGVIPLEAREDGTIVATAALTVRGECASLIAGSTLREFRRRGLHLALIRDRLARALHAGARIIFAAAAPASASERNFHRCGFVTLYTRARWDRQTV
ncbi:MAG: GNAT family N-acetyltransferase [Candidatus Cybelea sp.]